MQPERATISAGGDLGYLVEHNRVTFADSTGAVSTHYGKAVTVWRKNDAGEWKCVMDTWNANPTEHVFAPAS
jgi:ketosteroid isomerase-like protein